MNSLVLRDEFKAMGCAVEVEVVGGDHRHLAAARRLIDHLEQCWSRFISTSDVSRLNMASGSRVQVDPATITLLEAMVHGSVVSDGAFDPTLLAPLVSLGYSASWTDPNAITLVPTGLSIRGSIVGTAVDRVTCVAQLPEGTAIDAGGIGKGLAADRVVRELLELGALGAMVSIGGDLRVSGIGPAAGHWRIGVADVVDHQRDVTVLALADGGIATSGTLRRAWTDATERAVHHLLDPSTRQPLAHGHNTVVQATVIAGTAATAEIYTKTVMVLGAAAALPRLDAIGLGGRAVLADGQVLTNATWASFDQELTCSPN